MQGKLIVLEGYWKTGKSSIVKELKKIYPKALFLRQPGTTKLGELLRDILLHQDEYHLDALTMYCLFVASRRDTMQKIIWPALKNGQNVFSERWFYSSIGYQIVGEEQNLNLRNILNDTIHSIVDFTVGIPKPDLNIILDIPFEVALSRKTGSEKHSFEKRPDDFQRRVYKYYTDQCPGIKINANRPIGKIVTEIVSLIDKL